MNCWLKITCKMLFTFVLLSTAVTGCVPPNSMTSIDTVESRTSPLRTSREVALSRLAYSISDAPYSAADLFLTDFTGIITLSVADAFGGEFVPDGLQVNHAFISATDIVSSARTDYAIINRSSHKRTDASYFHRQPSSGTPSLREDGQFLAAGVAGVKGESGYVGLPILGVERVYRALPLDIDIAKLETAMVYPLFWVDKDIHAVFIFADGTGIYFVSSQTGKQRGLVKLEDIHYGTDFTPRAWVDPGERYDFITLSAPGGYYIIDPVNFAAEFHALPDFGEILGLTVFWEDIVWMSRGPDDTAGMLYFRNVETHSDAGGKRFGDGKGTIGKVIYSYRGECIFFEMHGDIWRMDVQSGVQGRFTDTEETNERLLWSQ